MRRILIMAKRLRGFFLASALLVFFDQLLKRWAVATLKGGGVRTLFPGILSLTYVENTGMAFGLAEGGVTVLAVVSLLVAGLLMYLYLRLLPKGKGASKAFLAVSLTLLFAGAIGNGIDRVFFRYVVDFLAFSFIRFPVFNLADCYVVVGCILLLPVVFMEGE